MLQRIKTWLARLWRMRISIGFYEQEDAPAVVDVQRETGAWYEHVLNDADLVSTTNPIALVIGAEDVPAARATKQWLAECPPANMSEAFATLKLLVWLVSDAVTSEDDPPFIRVETALNMMREKAGADEREFYDSALNLADVIGRDATTMSEATIDVLFSIRWWLEYTFRVSEGDRLRSVSEDIKASGEAW